MSVDILLGLQWGDEGKGKIIDYLSPKYDIIARFQGGPNAGHTLVIGGQKTVLHTVPSGIMQERPMNVIGNGVIINPITLKEEIEDLQTKGIQIKGKLLVSRKAHFILPTHIFLDKADEEAKGGDKIGSTGRGIGPTYVDKIGRKGLRVGYAEGNDFKDRYQMLADVHKTILSQRYPNYEYSLADIEQQWFEAIEYLLSLEILMDTEYYINHALSQGQTVLAEGAQGTMLDIDFGTYRYVTSSNTIAGGACTGLGIGPNKIKEVIGIAKAYCTRVGSGPFPSELDNEVGEQIRQIGNEFGATTGRPRRTGWIDVPQLQYAVMVNGVTQIALTKSDVLNSFEEIQVCNAYTVNGKTLWHLPSDLCTTTIEPQWLTHKGWKSDLISGEKLPENFDTYVKFLEGRLKTPITLISTGPEREKLIVRN